MKTIVFACNSNSCRSQMAEGWAKDWLKKKQQPPPPSTTTTTAITTRVASIALQQSAARVVKANAIWAMAQDGIDISNHTPKTLNELLPLDTYTKNTSSTTTTTSSSLNNKYNNDDDDDEDDQNNTNNKPIDVLIVLCSCGDDVIDHIGEYTKSLQVWNVEAPTTLAKKTGEGRLAYRRISLEIRNRVETLMEEVHQGKNE